MTLKPLYCEMVGRPCPGTLPDGARCGCDSCTLWHRAHVGTPSPSEGAVEARKLSDFDECECGDWRHEHEDGYGRCTMPDNLSHGFKPCESFRLAKRAVLSVVHDATLPSKDRYREALEECAAPFIAGNQGGIDYEAIAREFNHRQRVARRALEGK